MITSVILAGGNSSFLWPLSRKLMPRFLYLSGEITIVQETVLRSDADKPLGICNEKHRFIVLKQFLGIYSSGFDDIFYFGNRYSRV